MNTYRCSNGDRVTQSQVDARIRKAKEKALERQIDEFGYNLCENCGRNGNSTHLDCSHDISVKKAKETGRAEQCWNVGNITIICRKCHQAKDKLNLKFSNYETTN